MAQLFASTRKKKKSSSRRRRRRRAQTCVIGSAMLFIIIMAGFMRFRIDKALRCMARIGVCEGERHFMWKTFANPTEANVIALLTGDYMGQRPQKPPAVGQKYHASGQVIEHRGATVLCRISQKSEAFKDMSQIQDSIKLQPFADAFEFLPPHTFHVTVASIITKDDRGTKRWPKYIPRVKPMFDAAKEFAKRFKDFKGPKHFKVKPTTLVGALAVVLDGKSRDESVKLRNMRGAIYDTLKVPEDQNERGRYVFHVSIGYLIRWLSEEEAIAVHDFSQMMAARWVATNPVIDIGPPELCTYQNVRNYSTIFKFN